MEARAPVRWRAIDRRYNSKALIIADLSNDPSYAEVLFENFGARVIGVQITSRWRSGITWSVGHSRMGNLGLQDRPHLSARSIATTKCKMMWSVFFMAETVFALMSS